MDRVREATLPAMGTDRRRRPQQPPDESQRDEQQHGDADRLVELEHREAQRPVETFHPQPECDLAEQERGDRPMQDDRHGRIPRRTFGAS